MNEITVFDLKRRTDAGEALVVLDVREPDEIATAALPGATLIPAASRACRIPASRASELACRGCARS